MLFPKTKVFSVVLLIVWSHALLALTGAFAGEPASKELWSFQPVQQVKVPSATGPEEAWNEVDRFLQEEHQKKGIRAVNLASPEARLRRLKMDLTGLLPTLDEQDEFLAEPTRKKWSEMADRWMNSRAFGEKWGRHWLDLVRYADTSGGGRAMPLRQAWRFRDYVIDSFAKDRPLDQLIQAHLAGDLLPHSSIEEESENLIATGFLVLGPHNYENQNKEELNLEIADEQMDTMGRAFMGMTFGCARCHDHKTDPISIKDYYAMAGIFLSTNSVSHANVSRWHEEPVAGTAEEKAKFQRSREVLIQKEAKRESLRAKLEALGAQPLKKGKVRQFEVDEFPGVVVDNRMARTTGEWTISHYTANRVGDEYLVHFRKDAEPGAVTFPAVLPKAGEWELRISYVANKGRSSSVPVEVRVGERVEKLTLNQEFPPEHGGLFHTVGRFGVTKQGMVTEVTLFSEGAGKGVVLADAVQWLPVEAGADDPKEKAVPAAEQIAVFEKDLAEVETEIKELEKFLKKAPQAMCAVDRKSSEIGDTELRNRGVESDHGPKIPRGVPAALTKVEKLSIPENESGRLELAQWVTSPENPLTARVLANRIWKQLLGKGLVRSVDNFGATGELPSHPELLDFLAGRLVESGWSTKAMVRLLVNSRAYSLSSEADTAECGDALEKDPENRLLWRANCRPLDAEDLRDALLTLSNELDSTGGGPVLPDNFSDEFSHDFRSEKRSVYVPVFRNRGEELLAVFDFANPNFTVGERTESTLPTQALYLMNGEEPWKRARESASNILKMKELDDRARIDRMFRKTLSRLPTERERELSLQFLRASGDTGDDNHLEAWTAFQKSLFACLDFRFLR